MSKNIHEVRDPIHTFICLDSDERIVLNSEPFQRLRYINQLATTYLVYPGATHKRFEHSLGVMELASRVFDVLVKPDNIHPIIREIIPEITQLSKQNYWRRVLRIAALLHDVGHLPFSHAAEKELLPVGWDHERITIEFIKNMQEIWSSLTPPLRADDIIKLAVGPKKLQDITFSDWEAVLSEIIVGDAFGVDRIDYLLRDSYHAGVAYGRFDHYRLIDTLRILPRGKDSKEPLLGIEEGGLHSAEALLLARYFMYSQVYFHPVRRIYDIHLKDFLKSWLPSGIFSIDTNEIIKITDNEVLAALYKTSMDDSLAGYDSARRFMKREHYKLLYQKNPDDISKNPEAGVAIFYATKERYGEENVKRDYYYKGGNPMDFPVLCNDFRIAPSYQKSETLRNIPVASFDYIFIRPDLYIDAIQWLDDQRDNILQVIPKEV